MYDKQYRRTKPPINSRITVVQNSDYKWCAIDDQGNVVVPFCKYAWIDGFQNGLAKVIGYNDSMSPNIVLRISWGADGSMTDDAPVAAQGIVNEAGDEVLPLEYNIWKFYGKDYPTIKYFKGEEEHTATFQSLNPSLATEKKNNKSE